MNIEKILLIIIIIYLVILHCRKNIEKFAVTDDIRGAVKEIYNTDMEAVRQLAEMAAKLNTPNGLTIDGNLTVTGTITGTKTITGNISGNAATATSATSATSAGSASSATSAGTAGSASYVNNGIHDSGGWRLYNSGGKIGIGTTSPDAPLHVSGSTTLSYGQPGGTGRFLDMNGANWYNTNHPYVISIISEYSIWSKGAHLLVTSDERIKKNIVNLDVNNMINILRKIRPVSFDFIDPNKKNNKKQFGFIAQEMKDILPESINYNSDVITNNMIKGEIDISFEITKSFILNQEDKKLNYLLLITDTLINFDTKNLYSSTNIYKFKIHCGDEEVQEQDIYINSEYNIINNKFNYVIGMKNKVYDILILYPNLFIYGQYIYDLHILDHDTIWTVATAALQEVDKKQQDDHIRITELESIIANQEIKIANQEIKIANQEIKIANQEIIINNILERLNKLNV